MGNHQSQNYQPKWVIFLSISIGLGFLGTQIFPTKPAISTELEIAENTTQQLLQQGKALYAAERFSEALKLWQQAEADYASKQDILDRSLALSFISLAYQKLGDWEAAKKSIASSLSLLQTVKTANREKTQILAIAFNTQGRLQLSLGQSEDALNSLQKATASYTQLGDNEGIIGSSLNVAQTWQSLGFYRRAAKILIDLQEHLQNQPDSPIKVRGLLTVSNAIRISGDLEKARDICQQSLAIAQRLQANKEISIALLNLGNIELALAKKEAELSISSSVSPEEISDGKKVALEYYRQAAKLSDSANTQIQAKLNEFSLLLATDRISEAEALWTGIKSQINQLPPSRSTIIARINLVENLLESKASINKNKEEIAEILATAVQQAKNLEDKRSESFAIGTLAKLYEQNKQFKNAEELTKPALLLAQSINAPDIAYQWQWQLGRLLKAQGNIEGAIAAYTEAVNTLQSLRSDLATIDPEVQFSFRDSVEPVYRQLVDLLLLSVETIPNSQQQNRLVQARKVIESLQLAELDNFFREACLDARPKQIDQIDRQAAVIYPVILPDRIEVILSLPQQPLRHYTTRLNQTQIEQTINEFRQAIGIRHSSQSERLRLAQEIYNWLIKPAETELKNSGVDTLVFVLDGSLRNIPMAALYNGQQYLVEQYSIALTPGLQLLQPQPLTRLKLRALAGGLSEAYQGFSPLPAVRRELEQVSAELRDTTRLLDRQFTSTTLEREVKTEPFRVVHLATHGQFSSNSQNTFILAWDGPINVKNLDELLRTRNASVSNRPIELLVLSACETAAGDKRAALGLAGVALRAGASSTLATLWKVSDDSTAALMTEFYRQLGNPGITKAEALRQAQITLLRNRNFRTPYFWAPYVLVGNWL